MGSVLINNLSAKADLSVLDFSGIRRTSLDKLETGRQNAKSRFNQKAAYLFFERKQMKIDLIKKYQTHKDDTGSTEVQVALLTEKIMELAKHLRKHAKDSDSRRGLLMMVGKRRRLLNYLKKSNLKQYEKMIKDLGLKK